MYVSRVLDCLYADSGDTSWSHSAHRAAISVHKRALFEVRFNSRVTHSPASYPNYIRRRGFLLLAFHSRMLTGTASNGLSHVEWSVVVTVVSPLHLTRRVLTAYIYRATVYLQIAVYCSTLL